MNGNTVGLSLKTFETVDEIIDYYFEDSHPLKNKIYTVLITKTYEAQPINIGNL